MPGTLAWRTNSGEGGNTRLSVSTDSIVDDMCCSPSKVVCQRSDAHSHQGRRQYAGLGAGA